MKLFVIQLYQASCHIQIFSSSILFSNNLNLWNTS